ncbi:hypothetical protein [Paenilisteria rocourtiae]|uniref:hypothetical protein n=1 Tax=Listeria rocourtiae TaxID=647910 RepID=UPI001414F068|nr:hypothetical protein [Listeria rocourtiae]
MTAITLGQSFALTVASTVFKTLPTTNDKKEQTGAEMLMDMALKLVVYAVIILGLIAIASLFV